MKQSSGAVMKSRASQKGGIYAKKSSLWNRLLEDIKRNWILYIMILPVFLYFIIFAYIPMRAELCWHLRILK